MLSRICEANSISEAIVVYDYCDDYFVEALSETNILVEIAAEDDAVNLKQIMKWYDRVVYCSKTKIESKEDIQDRIKVLEKCVKNMKKCRYTGEGRVKYALKALIPFNDIWRLIRRRDAYAGIAGISRTGISFIVSSAINKAGVKKAGEELFKTGLKGAVGALKGAAVKNVIAGTIISAGELAFRAATYNKMLDKKIKETEEAIDFLKKKLKEY